MGMGVAAQHAFKTGPGSRGQLWVCHSSASGLAFPSCGQRIRAWGPCPAAPASTGPCFSPAQGPLSLPQQCCRVLVSGTADPDPCLQADSPPRSPRPCLVIPGCGWTRCPAAGPILTPSAVGQPSPAQPSLGPCPWRCLCIITAERPRLPSSPAGPAHLLRYCGTGPALQPCYGFWLPFLPQGAAGLRWALTEVCLLLHFPITSS